MICAASPIPTWISCSSAWATVRLSDSMLSPMIRCACRSSTRRLATAAQVGVIVHFTHGGVFTPAIGNQVQSVLSPPIRRLKPPYGARLLAICSKAVSGSLGSVPTSLSTFQYSVAIPTKPGAIPGPMAEPLTVIGIGGVAALGLAADAPAAAMRAAAHAVPAAPARRRRPRPRPAVIRRIGRRSSSIRHQRRQNTVRRVAAPL